MNENTPECYGCPHLCNTLGNFTECKLYAEKHAYELGHKFVDYFYWNGGAPNNCPLKEDKLKN